MRLFLENRDVLASLGKRDQRVAVHRSLADLLPRHILPRVRIRESRHRSLSRVRPAGLRPPRQWRTPAPPALTSSRFHAAFMRTRDTPHMNKLIQTGIAGFAAWKWGGGLIGTIILFLIVYYLLGKL